MAAGFSYSLGKNMTPKNDDIAGQIDPPQEPMEGTNMWIASGPAALLNDGRLAVLVVRLGMAANALTVQVRGMEDNERRKGATRMQNAVCSLVSSAAVTHEATKLIQEGMQDFRELASAAGARDDLLDEIGKLCGGRHPATKILDRARNNLGFHWDHDVVAKSVREYGKNARIIWIETADNGPPVFRLAADVLAHALIPEASGEADPNRSD